MTPLIISCIALALSMLALAMATGSSFKSERAQQSADELYAMMYPPPPDLAADLRREDLRQ